jgi:hypothetical protein
MLWELSSAKLKLEDPRACDRFFQACPSLKTAAQSAFTEESIMEVKAGAGFCSKSGAHWAPYLSVAC